MRLGIDWLDSEYNGVLVLPTEAVCTARRYCGTLADKKSTHARQVKLASVNNIQSQEKHYVNYYVPYIR